jgi:hypothetical protein
MHLVRVAALGFLFLVAAPDISLGHRSGCHRWHSCPSDTGSYTCGDLGKCSGCSDNQYCQAGQAKGRAAQEGPTEAAAAQPGVPPQSAWSCPLTHPIKGNFTTHSGEPCIHHVPGGEFYDKTKPERCYVTEADAVRDGCRRSKL